MGNYFAYLLGPQAGAFAELVLDPVFGGIQAATIKNYYKNDLGKLELKVLQGIGILEELLPLTDIVPTMTLTWAYTHFKKGLNNYLEQKKQYTQQEKLNVQRERQQRQQEKVHTPGFGMPNPAYA
ncbi:MAG: hypothetical protein V1859_11130 [archaeon]